MVNTHKTRCCSFCGKSHDQVKTLLAAPKGVHICDQCVAKFQKQSDATDKKK